MTRYQELQEELRKEEARLVSEFKAKAKQGDFVKLGVVYGILEIGNRKGDLIMRPLEYFGTSNPITLDSDNIPRVILLGDDFSEIAKYFRSQAAVMGARYSEEIPF